jgi:GNAT superfamily N-acetyltransferase
MANVVIRAADPRDALAVARVHVHAWQVAYRGLLPDEYLDGLKAEDRAAHYDFTHADPCVPYTLIAEIDGNILGFASTMPARDEDRLEHGELCALYVSPQQWGRGIGVALIEAARGYLAAQGFRAASLWVLRNNARAERFYGRDGWLADGATKADRVWGVDVEEIRYCRILP